MQITEENREKLYQEAISCSKKSISFKQVAEAREVLLSLGTYKESPAYVAVCDRFLSHKVGTKITFGNYQGKDLTWTILETNGHSMLLFADESIATQPFHLEREEITWNSCSLRKWLNSDFLNTAFSFQDRMRVMLSKLNNRFDPRWDRSNGPDTMDKVYVFSLPELLTYYPTEESRALGCWWWLRGYGYSNLTQKAVYEDGTIYEQGISPNSENVGVRPVMLVRIAR